MGSDCAPAGTVAPRIQIIPASTAKTHLVFNASPPAQGCQLALIWQLGYVRQAASVKVFSPQAFGQRERQGVSERGGDFFPESPLQIFFIRYITEHY